MRVLYAILVAVSILAVSTYPAQAGGEGVIRVGFYTAEVGEQVTVVLEAVDIPPPGLGAWAVDVIFDSDIVHAIACTSEQGGVCSPAFASDAVRVTGAVVTEGLTGNFPLATFTFTCDAAGTAELVPDVQVLATTEPIQDLDLPVSDGSITCAEPPDLITISSLDLEVGQQGTVIFSAELVVKPGLGAWQVDINYDPEIVSVVACDSGQNGVCNPVFDEDTVRLAGASASGLTGTNEFAAIKLVCDRQGASALTIRLSIWGNAIETQQRKVEIEDGTITCRSAIPAQLPSTGDAPQQPGSPPVAVPLAVLGAVLLSAAIAARRYASLR